MRRSSDNGLARPQRQPGHDGERRGRSRWTPALIVLVVVWVVLFCLASDLGTQRLDDGATPQVVATFRVFFGLDQEHRGDPVWSAIGLVTSIPIVLSGPLVVWRIVRGPRDRGRRR